MHFWIIECLQYHVFPRNFFKFFKILILTWKFSHTFFHIVIQKKVSYVDMLRMTYRAWFDRFAINMRWCVSLFCNVGFFSFRTDSRILLWYLTIYSKFVQFRMDTRIGIRNAILVNLGINNEDVRSLILK